MTDDVMGIFQTTRNAIGSGNQHEVSIYGDNGTIHASTLEPDRLIWIREEESGQLAKTTLDVPMRCKVSQYADFLAMLKGLTPDGLPGFMDGYRNQEVMDAIVRSSETKSVIRF
jgi:predicted dehydrogenase